MLLSKWPIKISLFISHRLDYNSSPSSHACTSQMTHKWKIYCIRQCGVLLQFDVHFCVCLWRLETLTLEIMHCACEIEWKLLFFVSSHSHDCWVLRKEKCLLIFCIFMVCLIYWRRWWRGCRLFGVRVDR